MKFFLKNFSFKSIYETEKFVQKQIANKHFDKALNAIENVVQRIISEPLCTAQIYASTRLDYLCHKVGDLNLKRLLNINTQSSLCDKSQCFIYIVTKLQKSGGHTRVIESFIQSHPNKKHIILSTERLGKSDALAIKKLLHSKSNFVFEKSPGRDSQKSLDWLQTRLLELKSERVYLFNHHQDSVAAAAIQPEMKLNAYFYHHGDHHLCLGVTLNYLKHIDPHPMGYHRCKQHYGIDNFYLPFTVNDKGVRSKDMGFMPGGAVITCTAARMNKVEQDYYINYLEFIPKLLQATKGKHIHIGKLTPWGLAKIRSRLKKNNIDSQRFIYIPWVESVWQALIDYGVDLYIASFPYGGGLTLIEAMGSGTPIAVHSHAFSRNLGGFDMAYPKAMIWRLPEELLEYCANLSPEKLQQARDAGRHHYEHYHKQNISNPLLSDDEMKANAPLPLREDYDCAEDEWAMHITRQIAWSHLLKRYLIRAVRRIKQRF